MTRTAHQSELGDFLKARRAEVSPTLDGLAEVGRARRVTGLRREEVASLAHISTDYYTRIEQGRIQATAPVLDTIARALELDEDQRAYMFGLAGKADARNARLLARQRVSPQVRRLLGDLAATPAFVIGRRTDILAWNALAAVVFTDFGAGPRRPARLRPAAVHRPGDARALCGLGRGRQPGDRSAAHGQRALSR